MPRGRSIWTALVVMAALMLVTPTLASAAPVRFGSKLNNTVQPSNAGTGHHCDDPEPAPHPVCTWVMQEAYGRPNGGHKAPKNGRIGKVRVIACYPGSFRIQIAKSRPAEQRAKVLRNGPFVNYAGDPDNCDDEVYTVNVIPVNFHINKGEQIAIRTKTAKSLRCSSGGDNTLMFYPPLVAGAGLRKATETDGCWLLVEYQYK